MRQVSSMRREGTTAVEMAVVLVIFLMLFMGVLEYGMYNFVQHSANHAVREGARFAVVRTGDGTTLKQVQDFVKAQFAAQNSRFEGPCEVTVNNVDSATGEIVAGKEDWTEAQFGGAIRVKITGIYKPIMPLLFFLPTSRNFEATSVMNSEGN